MSAFNTMAPTESPRPAPRSSWRRGLWLGLLSGLALGTLTQVVSASRLGTDNAAQETAQRIAPTFVPWIQPLRTNTPARERLLFIVQAGIGGALLGAALAAERQRRTDA
jgi:ABC-type cobalt transport system substrate-binding protein